MPSQPLHILLVEDDEVDQEHLLRCLQHLDAKVEVTAVGTATEALILLRGQAGQPPLPPPALILLDLLLPGLSGLEFLQVLHQDSSLKQTIVWVMTDSNNASDRSEAYAHGAAGYLLKSNLAQDCTALIRLLEAYHQLPSRPAPSWLRHG